MPCRSQHIGFAHERNNVALCSASDQTCRRWRSRILKEGSKSGCACLSRRMHCNACGFDPGGSLYQLRSVISPIDSGKSDVKHKSPLETRRVSDDRGALSVPTSGRLEKNSRLPLRFGCRAPIKPGVRGRRILAAYSQAGSWRRGRGRRLAGVVARRETPVLYLMSEG